MAEHVFTITELRSAVDPATADAGERFEWTADSQPVTPFNGSTGGGARACPVKPWAIPGEMRNVKTNYPNAKTPSRQIMGPSMGMQSFHGRWDDRYNGAGYAVAEWRRFDKMFLRGNLVRIQYGPVVYEGLITKFTPNLQRLWDIDYEIEFDPDGKPEERDTVRVPVTPPSIDSLLDRLDIAVQAMLDADLRAPRQSVGGSLSNDITGHLVSINVARNGLAGTIDGLNLHISRSPLAGFRRIATQFRAVRGEAYNLMLRLASVRSDLDQGHRTPLGVLDFEDWIRSLRYTARVVMGAGFSGDLAATERDEPDAIRLYRPNEGEHLYAISRKFYGTAHAWKLIYERNALRSFIMSGSEVLIIPERGGV